MHPPTQSPVYHLAVGVHQNAIPSRTIPVSWNISDGIRNNSQHGGVRLCTKFVWKMVCAVEERNVELG